MAEKIIRVPKGWPVKYCDMDGNPQNVTLTTNKEYRISLNNGAKVYPIITVSKVQKNAKGDDEIVPKLQLTPGYVNPITTPTCGNIPVPEISSVEEVKTGYVSERRSKKDMAGTSKNSFTFAFDKRGGGEYRITVYEGEMLAFSVKDERPDAKGRSRNIYGTFKDFDEKTNELIITRYLAVNNVRQITENYKLLLDNLFAIFRYSLAEKSEEDLKADAEAKKNRQKKGKKNEQPEEPAAETEPQPVPDQESYENQEPTEATE